MLWKIMSSSSTTTPAALTVVPSVASLSLSCKNGVSRIRSNILKFWDFQKFVQKFTIKFWDSQEIKKFVFHFLRFSEYYIHLKISKNWKKIIIMIFFIIMKFSRNFQFSEFPGYAILKFWFKFFLDQPGIGCWQTRRRIIIERSSIIIWSIMWPSWTKYRPRIARIG